jgi:predicted esterase
MFIHGGGFQGGTKTKPEIVDMANYFVARGWVFASIDYRTVEELGNINGMTPEQLLTYHKGIAPQTWMEFALAEAESPDDVQTSIAMYTAQRDAKAALRWLVANANTYNIDTDYISIGGASAGSITTVALGISDPSDFRDEISLTDDPTLSTTNLSATYDIKSMVHFWGSNVKLELFEAIYGMDRYDSNDPELFMAHGTGEDPVTPFSEAEELEGIYNSLGVHNELVPLIDWGHGAWGAQVDGKSLSDLSFDFIVARQQLSVE